ISHTGIAGLTLGGGIGWLTRAAGLSCDNLLAAEVVTADARIVRASASDDATSFLGIALSAPPEPFVPEQHRMKTGHALLVVGFGSPEAHVACIAPLRTMGVAPLFELVTP